MLPAFVILSCRLGTSAGPDFLLDALAVRWEHPPRLLMATSAGRVERPKRASRPGRTGVAGLANVSRS